MSTGWLLDSSINVLAVTDSERQALMLAKKIAKAKQSARQLGVNVEEVGYVAEAGELIGTNIETLNRFRDDVDEFLNHKTGGKMTWEKLKALEGMVESQTKDLIVTETLPFNEEARTRLRRTGQIIINVVQNMKIAGALLVQLVVNLSTQKYENIDDDDKKAMDAIISRITEKLRKISSEKSKAEVAVKKLAGELLPMVESLGRYFVEKTEPTAVGQRRPQEAKPIRTLPYRVPKSITEGVPSEEGVEASVQVVAQEIDEATAMQVKTTVDQMSVVMDEISEIMEEVSEELNSIYSSLVNDLTRAVALTESLGRAEAPEAVPALALASKNSDKEDVE